MGRLTTQIQKAHSDEVDYVARTTHPHKVVHNFTVHEKQAGKQILWRQLPDRAGKANERRNVHDWNAGTSICTGQSESPVAARQVGQGDWNIEGGIRTFQIFSVLHHYSRAPTTKLRLPKANKNSCSNRGCCLLVDAALSCAKTRIIVHSWCYNCLHGQSTTSNGWAPIPTSATLEFAEINPAFSTTSQQGLKTKSGPLEHVKTSPRKRWHQRKTRK